VGRRKLTSFRVELSLQPTLYSVIFFSLLAIVLAFACGSIIFLFYHISPWIAYQTFFRGAFGSWYAFSETLKRTIPLLLVGEGLALAFRAQVLNIGAEGQILLGAVAATWVALFFRASLFSFTSHDVSAGILSWSRMGFDSCFL